MEVSTKVQVDTIADVGSSGEAGVRAGRPDCPSSSLERCREASDCSGELPARGFRVGWPAGAPPANALSAPSAPPVARCHPVRASHPAITFMSANTADGAVRAPIPAYRNVAISRSPRSRIPPLPFRQRLRTRTAPLRLYESWGRCRMSKSMPTTSTMAAAFPQFAAESLHRARRPSLARAKLFEETLGNSRIFVRHYRP